MAFVSGRHGETRGTSFVPQRQRAPTITIQPADDEAYVGNAPQDSTSIARPAPDVQQGAGPAFRYPAWTPPSTAGSRRYCLAHLDVPRPVAAETGRESSCPSTISPSYTATRSPSMSSCSTFPDDKPNDVRRVSYAGFDDSTTSFSPEALAETVSSKSIAELEALGGLAGLARGLQTDLHAGLSTDLSQQTDTDQLLVDRGRLDTYATRRGLYGANRIPSKKPKGIFELMYKVLCDKVLVLLCTVAGISLLLGLYQTFFQPHVPGQPHVELVDSLTIMAAVLVVVVTEAVNDYQKEKQFAKLVKKTEDRTVKAIRSGKPIELSVFDVLVGDILYVSAGSLVAADGVLIEGFSVRCDESSLTGESDHVNKLPLANALYRLSIGEATRDLDPFIISGSKVLEGTGTYLVIGVGVNSMNGRLNMSLSERTEETPLQKKLGAIADKIAVAGVTTALLLFAALTIKLAIQAFANGSSAVEFIQILLRIFMISISIVAVAVPEGLPLAVTLALAIGVTRMLRDNNLVRELSACETMGNATVICSDKTGTLTMNQMSVVDGRLSLRSDNEGPEMSDRDSTIEEDVRPTSPTSRTRLPNNIAQTISAEVRDLIVESIAINTSALETLENGSATFVGSSTETALLTFCRTLLGMRPLEEMRSNAHVEQVFPFDSSRKYMGTVIELPGGTYRLYAKGAPDILLRRCNAVLHDSKGSLQAVVGLSSESRDSFARTIAEYGQSSLRTIGLAYRDLPGWQGTDLTDPELMSNMTFLGLLAIQDPVRPGVPEAVAQCAKAGVSVRMVTGDDLQTARAIAKESGILTASGVAMEGARFRSLTPAAMDQILPRLQVLARSSPEDKKLLVEKLKEVGETVAVTGDGTNDGPALRAADVGFSMGISGTDVAKEASSIVLMDDNFASIMKAVEWGRSINDGIKKFLHFQLTANITAVTLTCISALYSGVGESILSPAQLLWINLIMDTLAALALATEPADPCVLQRAPDKKRAPLISSLGWKMIIGQAIYQLAVITVLGFKGSKILELTGRDEPGVLETVTFNTFVWMQICNLCNNRRLDRKLNMFRGLHKHLFFISVSLVIIVTQVLIVTFGGSALSTVPLSATEWMLCIALGALCMPVAVLIRLLPGHAPRSWFGRSPRRSSNATEASASDVSSATADNLSALRHMGRNSLNFVRPGSFPHFSLRRLVDVVLQRWPVPDAEAIETTNEQSPLLQNDQR